MEDLRRDVLRHQVTEELVGRLIEDVVNLSRSEALGLLLDHTLFGLIDRYAGGLSRLRGGLSLFLSHLLRRGNLVCSELADRKQLLNNDALRDDRLELVVDEI